jgi:predicted ribosome quality control (RQC) complex YloA/Tae2 family protein
MQKEDYFLHADIVGAPHCIIKSKGKRVGEKTKKEAAVFAASFSRAWREGLGTVDVYGAMPEQISKAPLAGESLQKGAFMVYGKRTWFRKVRLALAVGVEKETGRILSGPISAIRSHTPYWVKVLPGGEEKGKTTKKIKKLLEQKVEGLTLNLDELQRMLPAGKSAIAEKQ